jgi:crotonobetainyl-CoA:carnitine CoA-transferase CaiB-like acyl-CoA transferase
VSYGVSVAALDDIVVVDLTRALAGPHASMMLGDLGARVIKIEAPGGDDTRGWGPPFMTDADGFEHSTYFMSCNRNKESIVVDLKSEDGRELLTRLVAHADVLVENYRSGVLERLGFSFERLHALNPRLICLSITGFGHDGPEGGRAGYDQIAQGEAGIMSVTGASPDEPTRVGVPMADVVAGIYGAYGVVAALHERDRTGRGQLIRTSLLAGMVGVHAFQGTAYTVAHQVPRPTGGQHPSICPYGIFSAADGFVQIAVGNDRLWDAFAAKFGLARDGWASNPQRVVDRPAVVEAVNAAFAHYPAAELLTVLDGIGIPAGKVRDIGEVYDWDQTRSQGLLIEVDHAALGPLTLPGPPLRFDHGGRVEHSAPPTLDQHGESIRAWLRSLEKVESAD